MGENSTFNTREIEEKWYSFWQEKRYFNSVPNKKKPYTIVMPPPNITGVLHIGHLLNNSLQDILIRRARMKGLNACWIPGIDHASIATEAKVVTMLKKKGIEKKDISREDFLKHAWNWKEKYGGTIVEQLKKIGCSCDWSKMRFTLEKKMTDSVIQVFISLYEKGLIYKDFRMVHWDPKAKTTLSEEEVNYTEKSGFLYYISYDIENSEQKIIVATTRPETIFGDTAICINPKDKRYVSLKGKKAIVPICNRLIPIIEDDYVDIEFGTGCLKITPAHDENDNKIGKKHQLETINIFNLDATLNNTAGHYKGLDRFLAREKLEKELNKKGILIKKEKHLHNIGTSERTGEIIEPRLSYQWFLKMKDLVQPAIKSVLETKEIELVPSKFKNTYKHWLENIRDWNISRQLWWGHRIPVYYYGKGKEKFVVAATKEKALELIKQKTGNANFSLENLKQEEDVLDTWFSSWLWPISVFDGVTHPNNKEIEYYYPTDVLVTGPDILFFWVARMIIAGHELREKKPFSKVYLTGLVRDHLGRKMSKQLGNSPDSIKLINTYGADAVRVGLMIITHAGNDLLFNEKLCQQGKKFCSKIWNAYNLITIWKDNSKKNSNTEQSPILKELIIWYENKFQQTLNIIEDHFEKYRISDALMAIYKLIWDDFCSWFLEGIKAVSKGILDNKTKNAVFHLFEENLKLLHPFMPFITEELWQKIKKRKKEEALCITAYPEYKKYDEKYLNDFEIAKEIIRKIRKYKIEKKGSFNRISISYFKEKNEKLPFKTLIKKMEKIRDGDLEYEGKYTDSSDFDVNGIEFDVILIEEKEDIIDEIEEETEYEKKMQKDLNYQEGFLKILRGKLNNEKFLNNAPRNVIENERKKEKDVLKKIEILKKNLNP